MITHVTPPPCRDQYGQFEKKSHTWDGDTCFECGAVRIAVPGAGSYRYTIQEDMVSDKAYHAFLFDGIAVVGKSSIEAWQMSKAVAVAMEAMETRLEKLESLISKMDSTLDYIRAKVREDSKC